MQGIFIGLSFLSQCNFPESKISANLLRSWKYLTRKFLSIMHETSKAASNTASVILTNILVKKFWQDSYHDSYQVFD